MSNKTFGVAASRVSYAHDWHHMGNEQRKTVCKIYIYMEVPWRPSVPCEEGHLTSVIPTRMCLYCHIFIVIILCDKHVTPRCYRFCPARQYERWPNTNTHYILRTHVPTESVLQHFFATLLPDCCALPPIVPLTSSIVGVDVPLTAKLLFSRAAFSLRSCWWSGSSGARRS